MCPPLEFALHTPTLHGTPPKILNRPLCPLLQKLLDETLIEKAGAVKPTHHPYHHPTTGGTPTLTEYIPLIPSCLHRLRSPCLSPRYCMCPGTVPDDVRHIRVFTTQIGLETERVRAPERDKSPWATNTQGWPLRDKSPWATNKGNSWEIRAHGLLTGEIPERDKSQQATNKQGTQWRDKNPWVTNIQGWHLRDKSPWTTNKGSSWEIRAHGLLTNRGGTWER